MFRELFSEENIDKNLAYKGIERKKFFKKRIVYTVVVLMFGLMATLLMKDMKFILMLPLIAIVGYKLPYYDLLIFKRRNDRLNSLLFPQFLKSFIALLPTSGNVYQALVASIPYTNKPLKNNLQELVRKLEDDNKREYFIEFAEYIGTGEAYMISDMIYQFSEYGIKKESLLELQRYSQELNKNKRSEIIERKIKNMEYLGFLPVFISAFLIISFGLIIGFYYASDISGILG